MNRTRQPDNPLERLDAAIEKGAPSKALRDAIRAARAWRAELTNR